MSKEEHLQKLLVDYTVNKYEDNKISIQKQDQNTFIVVYNPVRATQVTFTFTKEQILKYLDHIDRIIEILKSKEDEDYHIVKSDTEEEDGFLIVNPPQFNKNKRKKLFKNGRSPKKGRSLKRGHKSLLKSKRKSKRKHYISKHN